MTCASLESALTDWVQLPEPNVRCMPVTRRVAILLFEDCSFAVTVMLGEIFQAANEIASSANRNVRYELRLLSVTGGNVRCSSSICVWTDGLDSWHCVGFDTLFVSDGTGASAAARDERIVNWLRHVHANMIAVQPLGEGHRLFRSACAHAEPRSVGVEHGGAGETEGEEREHTSVRLELMKGALILLKRDIGDDCARSVAKQVMPDTLSAFPSLLGGSPDRDTADRVHVAARWLKDNCQRSITIEDAARVVDMSTRNFQRCFKIAVGVTPSAYLMRARFAIVCSLLTHSELPVDKIARHTGMSSGDRLAKVFRRQLNVSPTEYRIKTRLEAGI